MKIGDTLYYIDKGAKFYFDVKLLEIIKVLEHNTNLYKCEILYNNYKFNNSSFKPNEELKGKIDIFSGLNLKQTLEEAEEAIK